MRIGIFDSGLGGLVIAKAIRKLMPEYDYVYLGDTKRVPYGNRSHDAVFEFTKQGIDYLFRKENCLVVVIACNTASARALRRIQEEYLLENFSDRRVLGVLIPTAEECAKYERVGIIGTSGTIASDAFSNEIQKVNSKTKVFQNAAPMLVPLIEEGEKTLAREFIKKYLKPFLNKKIKAIALGCTHYPILKNEIKKEIEKNLGSGINLISQDEIIPKKLKNYLSKHPDIIRRLSKNRSSKILVTDITKNIEKLTRKWFGKIKPKLINI